MKRLCPAALLILCLLLCGCGSKDHEKKYEEFSRSLSERENLEFNAALRAEYEDRSVSFTLQYQQQEEGCCLTVLEPEIISGVSVRLGPSGSLLEYNSLVLDTGMLDDYGLSPLSALPALVDAMKNGHVESFAQEDGELVCSLVPSDELSVQVWFEPESMSPVHAELISDGRVRLFCDISNWR